MPSTRNDTVWTVQIWLKISANPPARNPVDDGDQPACQCQSGLSFRVVDSRSGRSARRWYGTRVWHISLPLNYTVESSGRASSLIKRHWLLLLQVAISALNCNWNRLNRRSAQLKSLIDLLIFNWRQYRLALRAVQFQLKWAVDIVDWCESHISVNLFNFVCLLSFIDVRIWLIEFSLSLSSFFQVRNCCFGIHCKYGYSNNTRMQQFKSNLINRGSTCCNLVIDIHILSSGTSWIPRLHFCIWIY